MFVSSAKFLDTKLIAKIIAFFALSIVFFLPFIALAHDTGVQHEETVLFGLNASGLEGLIAMYSIKIAITAGGIILFAALLGIVTEGKSEKFKKILFYTMMVMVVLPTLFFSASTVYLNLISATSGPVHWHLDFRIYNCGVEETLAGPAGVLTNKVGTPAFHHHDDGRIHVEGTIVDLDSISLGNFFSTIGGSFDNNVFSIPTISGKKTIRNGEQCPDGTIGTWQAFLFEQPDPDSKETDIRKIADPAAYIMKPQSIVPPGDCVVLVFGPEMAVPVHTCRFYDIAYRTGKLEFPQNWRPSIEQ